jgi:UDP-N-acetylglucosamine 2-epimerase
MIGNSSSGIIEAASLHLPAVNIGTRQQGRIHPANVIDVGYERVAILEGIRQAVQPEFRECLCQKENPYGCGRASGIIVGRLKSMPLDERLVMKRFHDLDVNLKAEN